MVPCGFAEDGGLNSKVKALALGLHTGLWTTLGGYCLMNGHAITRREWLAQAELKSKTAACLVLFWGCSQLRCQLSACRVGPASENHKMIDFTTLQC